MKQLERLLVFQGNRCFFCDRPIPDGEASVEHLVASANGGTNDDDNCVVCCKALNAAFGSKPYKEKLRAILNHRGHFSCPRPLVSNEAVPVSPPPLRETPGPELARVIDDLRKRGNMKPRKMDKLRNTISAVFKKQLSDDKVTELLDRLRARGYVTINNGAVSYNLPDAGA